MTHQTARQLFVLAALASFALVTTGCSTLSSGERPEITLAGIELTDATVFETTLEARIRISNPSLNPISVEGATFKLVLDGRKVGRGMMKEHLAVNGLDSGVGLAVFHINNAAALLRFRDIAERKAVSYGIIGNLYLQGSFGTTKVRVEKFGDLDLGPSFVENSASDTIAGAPS